MKGFIIAFIILTLAGPLWILFTGQIDWSAEYRTANRDSSHIAPDPAIEKEAVVQIYSARAFNWRGIFGTHIWIATKSKNASRYLVYQVVGWRLYYGLPPLVIQNDVPDRNWFGNKPKLIADIRGDKAEKIIPQIFAAAKSYPFAQRYDLWPGPNSNTFPAYIGRSVPELALNLPSDAIGKDYLPVFQLFARAPSYTGYQFSLLGIFGVLIAKKEGIEINILGLVYGIQFYPFAVKLPGVGNLSFSQELQQN